MPAIVVNALTKIFRTYKKPPGLWGAVRGLFHREYEETRAADAVSFSVEEGETVGFLGPNGAGKTTVLKMLSGLLHPTSGSATVLGFVPWERHNTFKRQFSLLMGQKNALWWDLPARESLELNRAIYDIPRPAFERTVDELTALLDCRDKLDVMVRELSLGERMKMELISALLHEPRVLFLDEPTIGLDVTSQQRVRDFLRHHTRERRITTLLTSHYMADIEELCPRLIIVDHGRLGFDGPLADITTRFGTHKIIALTFAAPLPADADFSTHGEIVEKADRILRIRVPRERVAETCRALLAAAPVSDISVQEPPLEDMMRDLFALRDTARQG